MATKKKPAPKKKPAAKPAKPAAAKAPAARAAPVDDSAKRELEAARAQLAKLQGELKVAQAERDKWRSDHDHVGQKAQGHQAELEKLRAETLKSSVDIAAANRRAEEATRKTDEAARRADERERERARLARELDAARAELGGYKLRCPKCGKNFVEENYEGITIDRCTGCDAIYFDAGEVDQLLAKVAEKTMGPSADPSQTSGWFRGLFKRKPKAGPPTGDSPPSA
jgi:Zn-finger nucleic acid-binding protein